MNSLVSRILHVMRTKETTYIPQLQQRASIFPEMKRVRPMIYLIQEHRSFTWLTRN